MSKTIKDKAAEVRKYPEHEKLKALGGKNQAVGEFVMFLAEKGIGLAKYRGDQLQLFTGRIQALIAEFFEIDEAKLEAEKQAMLDEQRALNDRSSK